MQLRCLDCTENANSFCKKLKEALPNGYAMLYFGGIANDPKHVGVCEKANS